MKPGIQSQTLNASSNLIGIRFVLITGLKITNMSDQTWADEISLLSAFALLGSCLLSYLALLIDKHSLWYEKIAACFFLIGLVSLFVAVIAFAYGIF